MKKAVLVWCATLLTTLSIARDLHEGEYVYTISPGTQNMPLVKRYFHATESSVPDFESIIDGNILFQPVDQRLLHIGNFNDVAWIRLHLTNQSDQENFIFEFQETYVDSLRLFVVKGGQVQREFPSKGLYYPENSTRAYLSATPSYTYDLNIEKGDTVSIYMLCMINEGTLQVSHELWNSSYYHFREDEVRFETTYLLLCGGFAILVIIIALTFYIFTRDVIQLYYIGFIISNVGNIILMANFFSAKDFERYFTFGLNYTDFFGLLQIFFGLQYTIHFLRLKQKTPRIYQVLKAVVWITGGNAVLFFLDHIHFINVLTFNVLTYSLLFAALSSMGIAVYLVTQRDLMARYFVVAYLPLLYFVGHYFTFNMGITSIERTLSWEAVIFFEIFVLTMAMAHRYYLIGKENIEYQKTINSQQKSQIKHIISAQEKERGRIARELHDGIVQEIGSVILGLRSMNENSDKTKEDTTQLLQVLEGSNRDLRTLSHQMMPKALAELGIVPATKQMLNSALQYTPIKHTFESFNFEDRPSEVIEITLYRIIQELTNNLIKHSEAKNVSVQLYIVEASIMLLFEDDGIGFDEAITTSGMGMQNIKSRLEMVNGTINFDKGDEGGALVSIKIPFKPAESMSS